MDNPCCDKTTDVPFEYINPRYILGIADEPNQILQPISGYAKEPLLALEDACKPLHSIVPRLEMHVWVAKQNSKDPADGLTQDESAAIRLYTMEWNSSDTEPRGSLYVHLNRTLKQIDRTKLRPWFRYLKLLLTALVKLPLAPRQTVWRGVRKDHSAEYSPGTESTWWAFSSCTTSLSVLESDLYLGNNGTRTLFSIETFNGRAIRTHSHFKVEDEILLLPGTFFEVKSRLNPAPDLFIVHLSQKRPPHNLLEPPFEGAEVMPPIDDRREMRAIFQIDNNRSKENRGCAWYKNNIKQLGVAALVIAIFILTIVLGTVLGIGKKIDRFSATAVILPPLNYSLSWSIPNPVSMADAFYAFDNNTFDLYSRRHGQVIGGPVSYVQGYVAYGKAIALEQNIPTKIHIQPGFNLIHNTSFTIEGFFWLIKTQLYAALVQLTPTVTMNLTNGKLSLSLGSDKVILGRSVLSTDQWHHFAVVYDAIEHIGRIFIDGSLDATQSSITPNIISAMNNSSIVVGAGFEGYIDQLSIILKAKSPGEVLWDATTDGYYPLDNTSYYVDKGPNCINASGFNTLPTKPAWLHGALNFNISDSYYQAGGFTALGTPRRAFTIALWIRAEGPAGVFLTVANRHTCLLTLALQNDSRILVAHLPNSTSSGKAVNIIGTKLPYFAWNHIAFTWSPENHAILYSYGYPYYAADEVKTLSNARGHGQNSPMTITLGHYDDTADCQDMDGINSSEKFVGSLDELYVFARELSQSEIKEILTPPPPKPK